MNLLPSAFSPKGGCNRRRFWGRMLLMSLGFSCLLTCYMMCLCAFYSGSDKLGTYQAFVALSFLLCSVFGVPSGILFLLPYRAMMGFADPPHIPGEAVPPGLLLAGMGLSALGMLLLTAHAFALAIRRLRTAGVSPATLALGLIPIGGMLALTGLLCFSAKKGTAAAASPPPAPAAGGVQVCRCRCCLLSPFSWRGRLGRRAYVLRSQPAALAFLLSLAAGIAFAADVDELYRNHVWILFFLPLFSLSVLAMASHPLVVLGLTGLMFVLFAPGVELSGIASGQGAWDAALGVLILLAMLLSALRLAALAARRLRDAGKDTHNLTAPFIPILLVWLLGSCFLEVKTENALLWSALTAPWLVWQSCQLLRRRQ